MREFTQTWQTNWTKKLSRYMPVVATLVVFGGIGTAFLLGTRAASPTASIESEAGTVSSSAAKVTDTSASGAQAVKFGGGSVSASCDPSTGVAINTTDNAQSIVNAHAAGTKYVVKAGTHQNNFSVIPKTGDVYCGEPGAVVDGGRTLTTAFSGGSPNVTLDSFTVQNYNDGYQGAAIEPNASATGWTVRNMTVKLNYWTGLETASGMKVLGGHFTDNDQMGIGGSKFESVSGVVLDGLDSDPNTYDGPELARNHLLRATCEFEGGGVKLDGSNVRIRNVWAHDNDCVGIWFDINGKNNLVEYNKVENNVGEGIFYEISQDACIRHNIVTHNGFGGTRQSWYWGAGIGNSASFDVEVYGNTVTNNFNGIDAVQQTRTDSTPPAHLVDHYYVHDNTISGPGLNSPGTDNGTNFSTRDIVYQNNTFLNGATSYTRTGTGYAACSILGFGSN